MDRSDINDIANNQQEWPAKFGYGRNALHSEVDSLNTDISPDGTGLPQGRGTVSEGSKLYSNQCARCHGVSGTDGPFSALVSLPSTTNSKKDDKAIGNYWPYATTVFDYISRAMPYDHPGTLSADEVYSLTAFLLKRNDLIDSTIVIDANTLPKVVMPALKLYVNDDRTGGAIIR